MTNKSRIRCDKCDKEITSNNFMRHYNSCSGPVKKKVRGVDFDPNIGYKDGSRKAWNKGLKLGPNKALSERHYEKRHSADTKYLQRDSLRRRIFEEQNFCCEMCGINDWMGKPITLELDHIDGNNKNNDRINLRGLCPNCHSQTDTWRGRKNRNTVHDPASEGAVLIRQ